MGSWLRRTRTWVDLLTDQGVVFVAHILIDQDPLIASIKPVVLIFARSGYPVEINALGFKIVCLEARTFEVLESKPFILNSFPGF